MSAAPVKKVGTDFTVGPIMPMLLKFFLPFLLANALNSLYNTVDTIIIGHFMGSYGIVAVSMGGKLLNLYTHISTAMAAAGQVLISQAVGAGKRERIEKLAPGKVKFPKFARDVRVIRFEDKDIHFYRLDYRALP